MRDADNVEWTIKAYNWLNGNFELAEWGSGYGFTQADNYFKNLHSDNSFAKIEMMKTTINEEICQ